MFVLLLILIYIYESLEYEIDRVLSYFPDQG